MATIAALVFMVDRLAKAAIVSFIGPDQPIHRLELVGSWLALEYVENRGAAFGLLPGLAPFLGVGSFLIVIALLVQYLRQPIPALWHTVALGAIVGGAVGNLLDRLRFGYVVDFIAVGPWPNFNIADSAITLGVIGLVWGWSGVRHPVQVVE